MLKPVRAGLLALPIVIYTLSAGSVMAKPASKDVLNTYADIAQAMFDDTLSTATELKTAVDTLVAKPSDATLKAARDAWKAARAPYQQTEALRFGNALVDEWEGKVNAWPLDEGLIDYVAPAYGTSSPENPLYSFNVVANDRVPLGTQDLNATTIDKALVRNLHEALGVESNVASGYHAIEFLLWGQDLNGTGPGAGRRPATDFDRTNCTGGHCDRRAAYLTAATDLLVDDLAEMAAAWAPGGAARADLMAKPEAEALATILTGIGSLSYGELAGERMKLGLLLGDPEEEQDCFSDNTHNSHYYDQVGMVSLWSGHYTRVDGSTVSGPSLGELASPEVKARLDSLLADTLAKMTVMKETADSGKMAYDQMLDLGNEAGNKILQDVIDGLIAQTRGVEAVVADLGLTVSVEGSDSLDNPTALGR